MLAFVMTLYLSKYAETTKSMTISLSDKRWVDLW